ncbi:transposase [Acanthopleuribacter pedis]|uniref:Transposase n=1 Tax=Acanthopleuribacter pedis TaxID=442870 RepID=A0A8J7U6C6_9BACT|nr:transposase [Acanthopleuribacter pedis]MBO1321764.1 transposase [Acanthopleuribacter pedis]
MSRRPRIKLEKPIAYYHVMNRTAQQEFYFEGDHVPGFKQVMLDIFQKTASVFYVNILAWVIMDNHYHLCLEVKKPPMDPEDLRIRFERLQEINVDKRRWQPELAHAYYKRFTDLSEFMKSINLRTAIAFNHARNTKGHLWGARYNSKIIEDETGLLKVMCYIEHNPVKAGLSRNSSSYPWCSAGHLKLQLARKKTIDFPAIDFLKTVPRKRRARTYVQLVDELAVRLYGTSSNAKPEDDSEEFPLTEAELEKWREEFASRAPEDWSNQAFGSEAFQQQIALKEQAKKQKATKVRQEAVKRRRGDPQDRPTEAYKRNLK